MDRYDYMSLVDDAFKECNSVEEMAVRYHQMQKDLESLYTQNVILKGETTSEEVL